MRYKIEAMLFRIPIGLTSRIKVFIYKLIGLKAGIKNRFERGSIRRATKIQIGSHNTFSSTYKLWPEDHKNDNIRIVIGNYNYFNKNIMLDACGKIEIGNYNMFGP